MKFIELGIGNCWFIRTEKELDDGTEIENRGIHGPIQLQSIYLRIWIRHSILIIDSKEGLKRSKKNRRALKIIFGLVSQ